MINQEILQKVKEIALSSLEALGLELVEIKYHGRNRLVLIILADRPEGGITIDECALMNNVISKALDDSGIFNGGYVLEVSSPGADRPLKERNDFCRVINKRVRCFFVEPISNRHEIEGVVKAINSQSFTLDADGANITIPYSKIRKAKQITD